MGIFKYEFLLFHSGLQKSWLVMYFTYFLFNFFIGIFKYEQKGKTKTQSYSRWRAQLSTSCAERTQNEMKNLLTADTWSSKTCKGLIYYYIEYRGACLPGWLAGWLWEELTSCFSAAALNNTVPYRTRQSYCSSSLPIGLLLVHSSIRPSHWTLQQDSTIIILGTVF